MGAWRIPVPFQVASLREPRPPVQVQGPAPRAPNPALPLRPPRRGPWGKKKEREHQGPFKKKERKKRDVKRKIIRVRMRIPVRINESALNPLFT